MLFANTAASFTNMAPLTNDDKIVIKALRLEKKENGRETLYVI